MYVCICHAVTEDDVEVAIDRGAHTIAEIGGMTSAGTNCGSCHDRIEDLIEQRCQSCPLAAMQVA
jgi:bacterioferritin-associated ferredoxin